VKKKVANLILNKSKNPKRFKGGGKGLKSKSALRPYN